MYGVFWNETVGVISLDYGISASSFRTTPSNGGVSFPAIRGWARSRGLRFSLQGKNRYLYLWQREILLAFSKLKSFCHLKYSLALSVGVGVSFCFASCLGLFFFCMCECEYK
ncbi:hypothetical protein CDAR_246311 [Caerostris darwini]|uniref:Uncharacterized protein n=1 Tax=Caerostris darwini TaxID=1538125 RepID=A0AAV4W9Q2_9ARAC|nr:hypothetical protein CDAR_246311 [Caerostris darwini]